IAGALEPKGTLTIDAGAAAALRRGKSLLPAGGIRIDGDFGRGDAVVIRGPDGAEIGRGLVAYDAEDATKIMRKSSGDILLILGIEGRAEMVHRDDMVLSGGWCVGACGALSRGRLTCGNPSRCARPTNPVHCELNREIFELASRSERSA